MSDEATNVWADAPDVAEYPETGKVGISIGGSYRFHRTGDAVEHAGPE